MQPDTDSHSIHLRVHYIYLYWCKTLMAVISSLLILTPLLQVEMLQEGFEDWQPIIQQPKTMFIVKALQPNKCYQFRVLACNKYGAGLSSDASDMITTKGRGWLNASPNHRRKGGKYIISQVSQPYQFCIIMLISLYMFLRKDGI